MLSRIVSELEEEIRNGSTWKSAHSNSPGELALSLPEIAGRPVAAATLPDHFRFGNPPEAGRPANDEITRAKNAGIDEHLRVHRSQERGTIEVSFRSFRNS